MSALGETAVGMVRILTGVVLRLWSDDAGGTSEGGSKFQTETLSPKEIVSMKARCKSASVSPELPLGSCSSESVSVMIFDRSEMLERAANAPLLITLSSSFSVAGNALRENVCKQPPMCSRKLFVLNS